MKNLKKLVPVIAIILGLGFVFGASAFKASKKDVHQYQYTSNSTLSADILDVANWQEVDSETPSCGETGSLVCRYEYDGDMNDFQAFLEAPTTTSTAINTNAIAKKQ